ncbi:hypothetical protein GGX14DRAFT_617504 [Mycena pura]|uniref:Uncharacterized protein n=1 Tax=Mycena pura TaxID=153505 RepID=A0AAD6YDQ3_9AGAR|nr:hypothetical protein GGX14DRAFT_617504 [Mycena pura]
MLARVERGGAATNEVNAEMKGFGESLSPNSNDLAKELADVQNQLEAYRTEIGMDSVRPREDVIASQQEIGQLGAAFAKANTKIEYPSDRHRMSQGQFTMHGREIDDLTKRNQELFDQWTRIDIECSRVTEDLQAAWHGRIEQLRNECANLHAEKQVWEVRPSFARSRIDSELTDRQSVQSRLLEENKTLAMEQSHLSGIVKKMHHDLEKSGENDRRRLESQLQMLEGQRQDLKHQLSQERDSVRQKDIEIMKLQTRLDKTVQDFSITREALVGVETTKTHLEQRVAELNRQLKGPGSDEKLAVYERRPSTVRDLVSGIAQHVDPDLSREQQLEAEMAELRSVLKVTEVDLATARSHADQFREISQVNEAALKSLNATHDEYKRSTEAQIARHESEYNAIQEKLNAVQQEPGQFTTKYNELQKLFETERTAWTNDKKVDSEDMIQVDIGTSEKNSHRDRTSRENEVRQTEQRAKAAEPEEHHTQEVVAHAESPGSPAPVFDSAASESLFPSAPDDGNHQLSASLLAHRPSKVSRQSLSHSYAPQPVLAPMKQQGFIIQYAPKFQVPSKELGLAPGGISWLEFYKKNNFGQLAYAQKNSVGRLVKLDNPKIVDAKINRCINCLVSTKRCTPPTARSKTKMDEYHFNEQTVPKAIVEYHNIAVQRQKKPGEWMGDGIPEFQSSWNPSDGKKRAASPSEDQTAHIATMVPRTPTVRSS